MNDETLYDLMGSQKSIRRLRSDPIPDDVLNRIMQAATFAPSAKRRPWRMVMVKDAGKKQALGALYSEIWKSQISESFRASFAHLPEVQRLQQERTVDAGDYLSDHFADVPVVAVVCFHPEEIPAPDADFDRLSVVGGSAIYPAVQNFMLACRAEGVGCVLTALLCQVEEQVKEILDVPADWYTAAVIPMGYSVGKGYGPTKRVPVSDLFYENAWENQHT